MRQFAFAACVSLLIAMPAVAAPKEKSKKSKTPSLSAAVAKAHARIDALKESADTIPEMVDSLGVFKGRLSVTCKKVDIVESAGAVTLHATLQSKRGKPERYRTTDERSRIAEHNEKLREIRDSLRNALSDENASYRNDKEKTQARIRAHKERVRDIKKDHDGQLKEVQRLLREDGQRIDGHAKARKAACETIQLEIHITGSIPDEWLTKPKIKLYATVESFELGTEPEEIGGAPRIAKMKLDCAGFAKLAIK